MLTLASTEPGISIQFTKTINKYNSLKQSLYNSIKQVHRIKNKKCMKTMLFLWQEQSACLPFL